MKTTQTNLDFWAETWIGSVVLILLSCSFFSLFSLLRIGAWLGAAGALVWLSFRICRGGLSTFVIPRFHGIGWGIPVLLVLCLISLLAGPHCFLDTYSYRLPQMFFWLQEGRPWSVPGVDMRINQMPHVWPMLSASLFLPFGERAIALPNFIGLLFLAALFRQWASRMAGPGTKADAIALIFLSAPVFLMGASTNDNVVCCCAFLALSYHFADCPKATFRTTALSALAFALACGIKPQYLALAPIWSVWFLFSSSHPWRTLRIRYLLLLIPLLLLCSPIPTLAVNRVCWGSFMHPKVVEKTQTSGAATAAQDVGNEDLSQETIDDPQESDVQVDERFHGERSFAKLSSQLFALPFNPFFGKMNHWAKTGNGMFAKTLRRYNVRFQPLVIPEVASLELFVTLALILGLALSLVHSGLRQLSFILAVLTLMGFAVVYTHGGTLGRSFSGFFLLLFPVVIPPLARLPQRALFVYAALCLLVGIAVVITDPSRPLLPLRFLSAKLSDHSAAAQQLDGYAHYSERQFATRTLLSAIPAEETSIGIVIEPNSPIAEPWLERPSIHVRPYVGLPSADRLVSDGVRYLLFKSRELAPPSGILDEFRLAVSGFELVMSVDYVSFTHKGPEPWFLLKRENSKTGNELPIPRVRSTVPSFAL